LGEFNNWDPSDYAMRKVKGGAFTKTIELEAGHEYQFRYLVDGERWLNDDEADKYIHSGVAGEQNSVVEL
jgi:1,4-alpha-glucan branching enzyme